MDVAKLAKAWRSSSQEDLKVAYSMFDKKHYAYCLFFCHLSVEKELKRLYLLRREELPPTIHNLVRVVEKAGLQLDEATIQILQELTTFNIKARYEIIKAEFHRKATKSYTKTWLRQTENLLARLKSLG